MAATESIDELRAKIEQLSTQNVELENRGLKNKRRVTELESQLAAKNGGVIQLMAMHSHLVVFTRVF